MNKQNNRVLRVHIPAGAVCLSHVHWARKRNKAQGETKEIANWQELK